MAFTSSGRRTQAIEVVADWDQNNALFPAAAMRIAEAFVTGSTGTLQANLVYSFVPKHIHPPENSYRIAYLLPAGFSITALPGAYHEELAGSVPLTGGVAFDRTAATPKRLSPPFPEPALL